MESTMPWTEITRLQYRRDGLRFASDTTDTEWALLQPLMPAPAGIGRPRNDGSASHSECHSLRPCYRLSVAGARARISAALDRARLLLQLAGRRDLALHQSQSRQARASGRRAQADAVGRHHRQPERKDHGKRRPTWI